MGLGFKYGDEILVPSNTYIASILAISECGCTPVLVEPDINTYNINPALIEEKITDKTKANNKEVRKTFIVLLEQEADFKLSFNLQSN